MSCHALSTVAQVPKAGVPRIQRKCACGTANAPATEAPCAQCQAEAVHAVGAAPAPPAPPKGFDVGAHDDASEREADRTAQRVMNNQPAAPSAGTVAPKLQRLPAAAPNAAHAPADVRQSLGTPGMPLDPKTRSFFEPRFGRDFSSVRVHADDAADRSARSVDAQAYTVGHHVVFSRGRYSPAVESGRRLLAHELAHVVQQSHSPGNLPALQRKKGKGKGAGSCGILNAIADTVLGGAAHMQIQKRLKRRGFKAELEIPRATKTGGIKRGCAKVDTEAGYADVARVAPGGMSVAEIKPFYPAKFLGKLEARHYRRRAEQSKQRLTASGTCGKRSGPGPDDVGFQRHFGAISAATMFGLLNDAISGQESFGAFSLDRKVDLIAQQVGGGAIGYWCRLNAAGKKEAEDNKKKKKKKPKGKGGAANLGIGLSAGSTSAGAGNVGVSVSIDSASASVATAGASIAISSESATAGAAGASSAKDSTSATTGAAGASKAKDGESATAGAAGKSDSSGSTSASAGVAGSSKSQDSVTASAGQSGKSDTKDSVGAGAGGSGTSKTEGGSGTSTGSPKKPIDPKDVSGPEAEKTPDGENAPQGDVEAGGGGGKSKGEGEGGKDGKAEGDGESAAGGDKEAGGGSQSSGGKGGKGGGAGKGDKGDHDKGEPGKGDGNSGGKGGGKGEPGGTGGSGESGKDAGQGGSGARGGKKDKPVSGPGSGSGKGTGASSNPLGVYTVIPFGTSDAEREKIAAEAAKVTVMVHKASEAQKELLRHLSSNAPDKRYLVPTSEWVQKMMNVTKGLSVDDIQYVKSLNWTPGKTSEAELRKRIEDLLAKRPKEPPKGDGGSMKASSEPGGKDGSGGGKGGGKGTAAGEGKGGGKAGSQDPNPKVKKSAEKEPTEGADYVAAPPKGSKREVAGDFMFWILSGMSADSNLKEDQAVSCNIRVHDLQTERTFELKGVSITFKKRILTPITINGVKFNNVKFEIHFTSDFWSDKHKFYGRGGADEIRSYDFGRRKVKK